MNKRVPKHADKKMLVPINSKKELHKVLTIQKAVSDRARIELAGVAHAETFNTKFEKPNLTPPVFINFASQLLEKYARYPTLTEYQFLPHLADGEKWGATFGVTALVGALVLDHARRLIGVQADLRLEYLRFLDALAAPGASNIGMDALSRVFAILSENYGVVWASSSSLALTVPGKRVYLHLLDAAKFVEEAAEAAQKFK